MQRRQFLTGTLATLCGSQFRPAHAGQFSDRIKKAVKYHMVDVDASVEDRFRIVKDLGFDGIETRVALGPEHASTIRAYARAREVTGLPIHGVIHSSNPDLIGAIDQAVALGANSVLHVVRYNRNTSYLQNYAETQEIIRRAIAHAEKRRVMILIENVWATFLIEPLTMARYIDELNSPMVQSYFDVGNVMRWGWPHHWIEVLGQRVKKLDIKEYDLSIAMNQGMRKGFDKPIGQGSVPWESVRAELAKIDYRGWATAEVRGGDRDRLAEIAQQMDAALDLA